MGSTSIIPTLPNAYCSTTGDALLVFEAVLQKKIAPVSRRPHDRERGEIVQSGNIFVFNETESGIKRWTDGVPWSPSRILGNFLIYRELAQPFPPGEKKRAQKRMAPAVQPTDNNIAAGPPGDFERSLVGSLVDSYNFKRNGLVKKTISITADNGRQYHMISYYNPQDVLDGRLRRPSEVEVLLGIQPRPALTNPNNFRVNSDQDPPISPGGDQGYTAPPYNLPHPNQQIPMRPNFPGQNPQHYLSGPSGFPHTSMGFHPGPQVGVNEHFGREDHSNFNQAQDSQPRYQPAFTSSELRPQVSAGTMIGGSDAYENGWGGQQSPLPPLNTGPLQAAGLGGGQQYSDATGYNQLSNDQVGRAPSAYGAASPTWQGPNAYPPTTTAAPGRTNFPETYQQAWNQSQSPQIKSDESEHPAHSYTSWPSS